MRALLVLVLMTTSAAAASAGKADPRAVEACKAGGATFVQVSDCLPEAHVAVKMLDAFDSIYPAEAKPLKDKCLELNQDNISGAGTCVRQAVEAAVKLKATLPEGSSIDDPIFNAVSATDKQDALSKAMADAKNTFPDRMIWGGGMYHPYK